MSGAWFDSTARLFSTVSLSGTVSIEKRMVWERMVEYDACVEQAKTMNTRTYREADRAFKLKNEVLIGASSVGITRLP